MEVSEALAARRGSRLLPCSFSEVLRGREPAPQSGRKRCPIPARAHRFHAFPPAMAAVSPLAPCHVCWVPTNPPPFALCVRPHLVGSSPCGSLRSVGGQSSRLAPVRTLPFCCSGEKPWGWGAASQGWAAGSTPSSGPCLAPGCRLADLVLHPHPHPHPHLWHAEAPPHSGQAPDPEQVMPAVWHS